MKNTIKNLTDIATIIENQHPDIANEIDALSERILNACWRVKKWKKFAQKDFRLQERFAEDLASEYYQIFKISNKILDTGDIDNAWKISQVAQKFWQGVKNIGKQIAKPFQEDKLANMERDQLYQTLNTFLTQTWTNLFNQVKESQQQVAPEIVNQIDQSIAQLQKSIQQQINHITDPAHPSYFLGKNVLEVLSSWQPSQINQQQLASDMIRINNGMKQAEQVAAKQQAQARQQRASMPEENPLMNDEFQLPKDKAQRIYQMLGNNPEAQQAFQQALSSK